MADKHIGYFGSSINLENQKECNSLRSSILEG